MRTNAKEIPKQFAGNAVAGRFSIVSRAACIIHHRTKSLRTGGGGGDSLKKHLSPVTGYTKEVAKSPKDKKNGKKRGKKSRTRRFPSFEASCLLVPPFYLCHRYIVVSIVAAFPFVPRRFSTGCEAAESSSRGAANRDWRRAAGYSLISIFRSFASGPSHSICTRLRVHRRFVHPRSKVLGQVPYNEKHNRADNY